VLAQLFYASWPASDNDHCVSWEFLATEQWTLFNPIYVHDCAIPIELLEGFGDGGGEVGEDHVGAGSFYGGELF
jgi:hypothetical protein